MNSHTGKQMTVSSERCFPQSILNTVFMDSSCYQNIYRLDANVKHMVSSSRNTLSIKLCTVLSHAALSSEDARQHVCRNVTLICRKQGEKMSLRAQSRGNVGHYVLGHCFLSLTLPHPFSRAQTGMLCKEMCGWIFPSLFVP